MEQDIPSWLNQNFIKEVLEGADGDESAVTIWNFSGEPAVAPGNNYTSHLYRVQVEYDQGQTHVKQSVSLIVKAPIATGFLNKESETTDFFGREPNIYQKLLPIMDKKLEYQFGPKSFYCPIKNGLVLTDLKKDGYLMAEKSKQLNYSHCQHVFTALAKFHAASVFYHIEEPDFIETVGEEMLFSDNGPFTAVIKPWINSCIEIIGGILIEMGGYEKIANWILEKQGEYWELASNMCKQKTKGLNVLNHGDLWTNNMLFKYSIAGEVVDVKFIDFQFTRYASPALDLIYFIWSSANEEVRESRLQDLFEIYLKTLNSSLEQLGCKERLSAEELQEDLKSAADFALIVVALLLPVIMAGPGEVINMEECEVFESIKNSEKFKKRFNGESFIAHLSSIMRQLQVWNVS